MRLHGPRTVRPQFGRRCLSLISSQESRSLISPRLAGGTKRFSVGRPTCFPKEGEAVWHVTTFGSVYVTADPARAGSALVTIAVSNLDEHATALAARGCPSTSWGPIRAPCDS